MDYRKYRPETKEKLLYLAQGTALIGGLSYFFYRSIWAAILLVPILPWFYGWKRKRAGERRRDKLMLEFKEAALSAGVSLQAGYSVENAFREAGRDMELMYGRESDIYKELWNINQALASNVPLEKVLLDFGIRSGVREIQDFAEVLSAGKRSGGDLGEIIGGTVELIREKIEVKREIRTAMSAKMMEGKVMSAAPFLILGYIQFTSPGFFHCLYHNPAGICIMTGCLALYGGCLALAGKIVKIEV